MQTTRVLDETPAEKLEEALSRVMDVDEVLKFLALDITLVNNDGYWRDGSDFNVYLNQDDRILLTPHDANEGFRTGGCGGGAAQPDPLAAMDDPNKALRHKLRASPALRQRYLAYVREIAEKSLDWNWLGPRVERYRALIGPEIEPDTRKLETTEAFTTGVYGLSDGTPLRRLRSKDSPTGAVPRSWFTLRSSRRARPGARPAVKLRSECPWGG